MVAYLRPLGLVLRRLSERDLGFLLSLSDLAAPSREAPLRMLLDPLGSDLLPLAEATHRRGEVDEWSFLMQTSGVPERHTMSIRLSIEIFPREKAPAWRIDPTIRQQCPRRTA